MIGNPVPAHAASFRAIPLKRAVFGNLTATDIYSRSTLRRFWTKHPHAEQPLRAWFAEAKKARWKTPSDIKALHRSASFVGEDRVVFNIGGNKYRLVVAVSYRRGSVFVRFVGTHNDYGRIDVAKI